MDIIDINTLSDINVERLSRLPTKLLFSSRYISCAQRPKEVTTPTTQIINSSRDKPKKILSIDIPNRVMHDIDINLASV